MCEKLIFENDTLWNRFLRIIGACMYDLLKLLMGRTPFYWTLIELKHLFSNIEQTRRCSSIDDRTRTPEFWLRINEHRILKAFTRLFIEPTQTSFFRALNRPKRVHILLIQLEQPTFGFERSNIKLRTTNIVRPITN